MIGKVFSGRYKIIKKIGRGGMADIYSARDTVLDRTVAVKIMHPQFAQEKDFVARFKKEAQAAANLNHPNIVNIYDWGQEDHIYFIVMEYLEGWNLKQLIEAQAPLPVDEAIEIANQVCSALEFAHQNNVIHRDIKSQNIIITPRGQAKVADFGIARAGAAGMTQTGSVLGTAEYVSPEQAQGIEIGEATDIYSLGVVLYETLTGTLPFKGENSLAVAMKQVKEKPIPPTVLNDKIPDSLEAIILKALEKDPVNRYRSAEKMGQDLQRVLKGMPVKIASPSVEKGETEVIPPQKAISTKQKSLSKKGKEIQWLPWAALVLVFILLATTGYFFSRGLFSTSSMVVVPNLEGKTLLEATELLEKKGLEIEKEEIFSSKVEKGLVISQDPEAGVKIKEGSLVKVIVSKGEELIIVPDVIGMSRDSAIAELVRAGFEIGEITEADDDEVPAGAIISQTPEADTEAQKGTIIDLVVSKGDSLVKVPDVIGRDAEEATTLLKQLGLTVEKIEAYSDTVSEGNVISQTPKAGAEVKTDSTVTITVSKGKEFVTVPNLINMTEAGAISTLNNLGLEADIEYSEPISEGDVGYVLDQNPMANTKIEKGSFVRILVGTARKRKEI
ncbi:Stk1 family PASTA domain-containing Ser/Thr kinase [Candidatus Oleimmundimicrobium sp.]|uniref:Stk1 family PASTA domain-containing Ser/Thr kinase n=1 Tax=Candidatus Oleimmundimicrobium sp. TaxID=3060597 RepID=UPI00271D3373|nr:Stk1 family PASTA domain-containing Ser/Thr kinase [Candidatus Oleimmundimicrobium sp.]MDO8886810.1 Stk1 family PASTA domain-containing Ser/Thr kinase [Candidatus Oleimmundimicrobium sp.]